MMQRTVVRRAYTCVFWSGNSSDLAADRRMDGWKDYLVTVRQKQTGRLYTECLSVCPFVSCLMHYKRYIGFVCMVVRYVCCLLSDEVIEIKTAIIAIGGLATEEQL